MYRKRAVGLLLLLTPIAGCSGPRDAGTSGDLRVRAARATSNVSNESLRPYRVLQTTRRATRKLVTVTTREGVVVTTPDHLFARTDGDWIPASRLNVGDAIVSPGRSAGVAIVGLVTTDVPATDVYNLTVAKTHTYAVGEQHLLVHNVNCGAPGTGTDAGPSNPERVTLQERLAHESEQEARQNEIRTKLQRFREEHQKRLDEIKRVFNDSYGDTNCVYCTLGGLSDYDKLSVFLRDHGLNEKRPTSPAKNRELLERLKLRTADTPPPATFKKTRKGPLSFENPQRDAKKFMQESHSNTFALIIKGNPASPMAHSLIAVRKPDGSITYVDLQKTPPETYDRLNPSIGYVEVIPTDVDWRFNRELTRVVQSSPPTNPKRGWPN